jgi:hypothetical protein
MKLRSLVVSCCAVFFCPPSQADAVRGTLAAAPTVLAVETGAKLPDACALMPKPDLEALFPGQTIKDGESNLSALSKGPQFVENCAYRVRVPNPRTTGDQTKFAWLFVIDNGAGPRDFADRFKSRSETAAMRKARVEKVEGIGDEAFQDVSERETTVYVRKGALFFDVQLDSYSAQTLPNALALARQAAGRWSDAAGMGPGDGNVARNEKVEIPADTRESMQAPAEQWPDACAMLTKEDVQAVYQGLDIDGPDRRMAMLTSGSREQKSVPLPHPIGCTYTATETKNVSGGRDINTTSIRLNVADMAAKPEYAQRMYKVIRGDADLPGIGSAEQASIKASSGEVAMLKGPLTLTLKASSYKGSRDQAQHDKDVELLKALAARVAARLP